MCMHTFILPYTKEGKWRSQDTLIELILILSLFQVDPRIGIIFSGLAMNTFTC